MKPPREVRLKVSGSRASDVQKVAARLIAKSQASSSFKQGSPWRSGSFYLVVVVMVTAVGLVVGRVLPLLTLPVVLIFTLLATLVIGAMQLRHDSHLSEKGFLTLMLTALRSFPVLGRKSNEAEGSTEGQPDP